MVNEAANKLEETNEEPSSESRRPSGSGIGVGGRSRDAMHPAHRLQRLNPLRLFQTSLTYQQVPSSSVSSESSDDSFSLVSDSEWPSPRRMEKSRSLRRMSMIRLMWLTIAGIIVLFMLLSAMTGAKKNEDHEHPFYWQGFYKLDGYYNGIRTLVPVSAFHPQNRNNQSIPLKAASADKVSARPPLDPVIFSPYPNYDSSEYMKDHQAVLACFIDANDTSPPPGVYAYPGIPQHAPSPILGSYRELGIAENVCFDRFGRLGPYGLGGGEGSGYEIHFNSDHVGMANVIKPTERLEFSNVD